MLSTRIRAGLVLGLLALLFGHRPDASAASSPLPRYTIQGVGLGMTREQVEARVGRPVTAYALQDGGHGREYRPPGTRVLVNFQKSRAVFVGGTRLERDGRVILRSGATAADLQKALGVPDEVLDTGRVWCYGPTSGWRFRKLGLTVNLGAQRVTTFYLFRDSGAPTSPSAPGGRW